MLSDPKKLPPFDGRTNHGLPTQLRRCFAGWGSCNACRRLSALDDSSRHIKGVDGFGKAFAWVVPVWIGVAGCQLDRLGGALVVWWIDWLALSLADLGLLQWGVLPGKSRYRSGALILPRCARTAVQYLPCFALCSPAPDPAWLLEAPQKNV